jgi:hypothetical protein
MEWIQRKYILLLSNTLERFTERNGAFNFRCPLCGDSKKNKSKARGYFLKRNGKYHYMCHNCEENRTVDNFLKELNPMLFQEYKLEVMKEFGQQNNTIFGDSLPDVPVIPKPVMLGSKPLKELKAISQLHQDHKAAKYIWGRAIPANLHYKIFYVENGYAWAKKWLPEKYTVEWKGKDPRVVLPLVGTDNKCYGAIARAIGNSKQRYLKLNWANESGFVYGLDAIDKEEKVYVMEGQFDSLFIPNSIAVGSMAFDLVKQHLPEENTVIVLDNEPRSKFTVNQMKKAVDKGYKVCVWPSHIKEKDINDMILSGIPAHDLKVIIDTNTHSGLKAKLAISAWQII